MIRSFFDRYFHILLPILRKHECGLPFLPRNLPIKFGTNPSTIFLVIVVTGRHTDTQTNAGKNTLPRFRRENNSMASVRLSVCSVGILTVTRHGAACDAARVHFGPTIRRADILVMDRKLRFRAASKEKLLVGQNICICI